MPRGRIILDTLVYEDLVVTNDPLQRTFDWNKTWDVASMEYATDTSLVLTAGAFTRISLPTSVIRWLQIYTGTALDVVYTSHSAAISPAPTPPASPLVWGVATALGTWVSPMSTDGTKDGVFFVRGHITDLYIGVPGTTAASVKLFMAY